ncbi:MAG TPA: hypothetical protein VGD53_29115 [Actinoallomurus sp.]|jgi:hypothetical protein
MVIAFDEPRTAGREIILVAAHEGPWGPRWERLMSPEGVLVGISYPSSFGRSESIDGRLGAGSPWLGNPLGSNHQPTQSTCSTLGSYGAQSVM